MSKVLILTSNPRRDLNLNREISDLTTALQRLGRFELRFCFEVRTHQLSELLAEHSPEIVHFCGHGAGDQGLFFQDENGGEQLVSTEILSKIFKTFSNEINLTMLNACDSDRQAEAIVVHINYVIGMSQPILDQAALSFSVGFYKGLAAGKSIEQAYEMGCIAIQIWSETQSQSTQTRQYRKLEYAGDVVHSAEPQLAEYMKPVLLKRSERFPSSPTGIGSVPRVPPSSASSEPSQEFVAYVQQEMYRKKYKDNARDAYDNFGQFSAQNAALFLEKNEYKQRKILLGKVKQFWIEGFLQPSLQNVVALSLDLKDRPEAIADFSQGIEALSVDLDASYVSLRETQIYREMGQGGRTLLILGSPGAGKTIALLQLAQRLIERSEQNLSIPMPVVFNLSSWTKDRKQIFDWLINELQEKYQVPKSLSEPWIKQQQLILLLDGLDEVKEEHRNDCVRALNKFIGLFPQTEVAVCSRVRDYEALTERLQISSALCLQPLSSEQVYQSLDNVGGPLAGLKTLLKRDAELEQFAQTPLMLNFMNVAYQGWPVKKLIPELLSTPEQRKQNLFDTYIDRRLERGATSEYPKVQVLRWLSWLAKQMSQMSQSVFQIEEIQPQCLPSDKDRITYRIVIGLILGVLLGLIAGIYFVYYYTISNEKKPIPEINMLIKLIAIGMLSGLMPGLITGRLALISNRLIRGLVSGIIFAISISFFLYLIHHFAIPPILLSGLLGGAIFSSIDTKIEPVESIEFDLNKMFNNVMFFGIFGILYALVKSSLSGQKPNFYSVYEVIILILVGVFLGGFRIHKNSINPKQAKPNDGICRSLKYTVITFASLFFAAIFICWGMDFKFQFNPVLMCIGLAMGLLGGLGANKSSGVVCIQHFTLRQMLYKKARIHWNYAKFLDFASDRLLMKKIGDGYIFYHRMLWEHFARMEAN